MGALSARVWCSAVTGGEGGEVFYEEFSVAVSSE